MINNTVHRICASVLWIRPLARIGRHAMQKKVCPAGECNDGRGILNEGRTNEHEQIVMRDNSFVIYKQDKHIKVNWVSAL